MHPTSTAVYCSENKRKKNAKETEIRRMCIVEKAMWGNKVHYSLRKNCGVLVKARYDRRLITRKALTRQQQVTNKNTAELILKYTESDDAESP